MAALAQCNKIAEKLSILKDFGEGLLNRLYKTQRTLTVNKPSFLSDPQTTKVLAAVLKKFPDVANVDKVIANYKDFRILMENWQSMVSGPWIWSTG